MKKSVKAKKPVKAKKSAKKKVSGAGPFFAQSKRLSYRLLEDKDSALYCGLYTNAKIMEFVGAPLSQERAERSFKKALEVSYATPVKQCIIVVVDRASKKAIGISGFKLLDSERRCAEGGLMFSSDAHAKRFSNESSLALIDEAFLRSSINELSVQVALDHKVGEKLVVSSGYSRCGDISATANHGPRSSWSITRDVWVATYKRA